jgi:uncharacterized membrane protein YfcA
MEWILIGIAGMWAGLINSVVGSGTLVTFPTLLWLGVPPITANVSNNIGLVPGAITAMLGTRDEHHARSRYFIARLLPASIAGSMLGAALLLVLPEGAFAAIAPFLVLAGVGLVIAGPRLTRMRGGRPHHIGFLIGITLVAGIYGGYFGAAQGVILIAVLSVFAALSLREANALKNLLVGWVNLIAGVIFIFTAHVNWAIAGVIAIGSTIGAYVGAKYGRRIPAPVYRTMIVLIGLTSATWLLLDAA